jgi:EAL domain-containing protein (putative c-di-GMP-specific phosphodiesterase class I)
MTGTVAVLTIDIAERDHLIDIFGHAAIDQALADFGTAADDLIGRLLAQHEILSRKRRDAEGRWSARFHVLSGGMPRDAEETCTAIEEAGRKLVHDLLNAVFGTGTGMRVPVVLAVLILPPDVAAIEEECPTAWVDAQLATRQHRSRQDLVVAPADVEAILSGRLVRTVLQPIVRMRDRAVLGYEALARGPQGSPLERPDLLFEAAHAAGRTVEMELLCAELALERTLGKLPAGRFLTINLGPDTLARAAAVLPLAGRTEVMMELTEHLPLGEAVGLADAVARLRALGIGLALDDTGCGFADMHTAGVLRPEIVKLCITVIRNADKGSPYIAAICETTERLRELGCRVLAEGVETEAQHAALADCRIELAQGWLYGRPAPVDAVPIPEKA